MMTSNAAILHRSGLNPKKERDDVTGLAAERRPARQISVRRVRSWMAQTIRAAPTAAPIQVCALEKNPPTLKKPQTLVGVVMVSLSTTVVTQEQQPGSSRNACAG